MEFVENRAEKQRGAKETEHDHFHIVAFLAGTALLMACLKQAFMASLIQQWRAWVFLVLNLVLLAILFTSTRCSSPTIIQENRSNENIKLEEMKRRRNQYGVKDCYDDSKVKTDQKVADVADSQRMSKEELNERAEAFIVMFRKHLLRDAKHGSRQFFASVHNNRK